MKLEVQPIFIGSKGLTWEEKFSDQQREQLGIGKSLTKEESELVQRFNPTSSDSIGFFIAKFIKTLEKKI